ASPRSSRRTVGVVLGGLVLLAVIVFGAISLLGGGSSKKSPSKQAASTVTTTTTAHKSTHHKASKTTKSTTPPASAADTTITVLNGTETAGLAHQVSASLQQHGYSQAAAVAGRPAGENQATVVEYASGHQADAEAVARSLSVSQVQPLESAVTGLAASARVVVIVGHDKATTGP
ncbi:MAG: LytR C-terminal domain-containing protein, partial [Solirubrobacterales bacterium]|nr:LytR C-terminal domain-containing protein [Solirubrobacterales bacterium]